MDTNSAAFVAMLFSMPVAFVVDPFAPPLVFGLCLRAHLIHDPVLAGAAFAGFASPAFIVVAALLYVGHAVADKAPPVAHLMDLIGLVAKPLCVALIGFWVSNRIDSGDMLHWVTLSVVLVGGVPATAALQALRTKVRLAASVGTLGAAHPFVSGAENVAGLGLAALALLKPELALALILIIGLPLAWLTWRLMRAVTRRAARVLRAGTSRARGALAQVRDRSPD